MMRWGIAAGVLMFCQGALAASSDRAFSDVEASSQHADGERAAVLSHNRRVSDADIEAYMEFVAQRDEQGLAEWRALDPEVRAEHIAEHRRAYDDAGLRIPTLGDLSSDDRAAMEQMAPFLAVSAASARFARERLLTYSDAEYRAILAAGRALIEARRRHAGEAKSTSRWTQITKDVPAELAFLTPELIRVWDDGCDVYLHKGFGTGIGYGIGAQEGDRWTISSFDEYESWQRTEIRLDGGE
jgi:hypothetical protein